MFCFLCSSAISIKNEMVPLSRLCPENVTSRIRTFNGNTCMLITNMHVIFNSYLLKTLSAVVL